MMIEADLQKAKEDADTALRNYLVVKNTFRLKGKVYRPILVWRGKDQALESSVVADRNELNEMLDEFNVLGAP